MLLCNYAITIRWGTAIISTTSSAGRWGCSARATTTVVSTSVDVRGQPQQQRHGQQKMTIRQSQQASQSCGGVMMVVMMMATH